MRLYRKCLCVCVGVTISFVGLLVQVSGAAQKKAKPLQTVTVGLTSYNSLHIWEMVANHEPALMEKYGIKMQVKLFQSVAEIIPGIISGTIDTGSSTIEGTFAAQDKGGLNTIKLVAIEDITSPYQLVTAKSVKSVATLKGKTIAVDSIGVSSDYVTSAVLLARNGITQTDVHYVDGGAPATRVAGLESGTIGATLEFPPGTQQLVTTPSGGGNMKVLLNAGEQPYFKNIAIGCLEMSPQWYNAHHVTATDFMKGMIAVRKWMTEPAHKSQVVSAIATTEGISQALATTTYNYMVGKLQINPLNPTVRVTNLLNELKNDKAAGIGTIPDATASAMKGRYDNSMVNGARR